MKNCIAIQLLFLFCLTGASQGFKFELPERQIPVVNKEKLNEVKLVTDLTPLLWKNMALPMNEAYFLEHRRINEFPQPVGYLYPQEKYKLVIDYVSVEITATVNGKRLSAKSTSEQLTTEQKSILNTVDLGTDIRVATKFKYKDQGMDNFGLRNNIIEGVSYVTVVPETEAQFPGGWKQLSNYFEGNVIGTISDKRTYDIVLQAAVKFTINEEGKVTDVKITQTSSYAKIDQLILDAVNNMPKWNPAVNSKGEKIKQEINIPFSNRGC